MTFNKIFFVLFLGAFFTSFAFSGESEKKGPSFVCDSVRFYGYQLEGFPTIEDIDFDSDSIEIEFDEDIVLNDGFFVRGFELAGELGIFYSARGKIEGDNEILLYSDELKKMNTRPKYVRYNWRGSLRGNLLGKESKMPLPPFTTGKIDFAPIRVACVGDSITFGLGLKNPLQDGYPALLQHFLGAKYWVENFGSSGSCVNALGTRAGAERSFVSLPLYKEAIAFSPDILVINLGINDVINWNEGGREIFYDNFLSLLRGWMDLNPKINIWIATPLTPVFENSDHYQPIYLEEINAQINKVAKKIKAKTINLRLPFETSPHLFPDGLHPNGEGIFVIAETVKKSLLGE